MAKKTEEVVVITPPKLERIELNLEGTAPLLQHKFNSRVREEIEAKMREGSTTKKGRKKEARDFEADMQAAIHYSDEGWIGIPATAFRAAAIDVCRMVRFKMAHGKMAIFALADGIDRDDGQPLVRLLAGEPENTIMAVRNATGVMDLRARPMWRKWGVKLRMEYDADQFTASDVVNLIARAGVQVGIGPGRPFSKMSYGMGYGTFKIAE